VTSAFLAGSGALSLAIAPFKHWKESANQPMWNWRIAANALACITAYVF
jgi:hypothetical protein